MKKLYIGGLLFINASVACASGFISTNPNATQMIGRDANNQVIMSTSPNTAGMIAKNRSGQNVMRTNPQSQSTYSYSSNGNHYSGTYSTQEKDKKAPDAYILNNQNNSRYERIATDEIVRQHSKKLYKEHSGR